jgi:hypothetical protein
MACPDGRTSDLFTHNCALPVELLQVVGAMALILEPLAAFLCVAAILRSKRSFWGRDGHFKLIIVSQTGLFLITTIFVAPLAFDAEYWNNMDRNLGAIQFAASNFLLAAFSMLSGYRWMRHGMATAFALSPNLRGLMRKIDHFEAAHSICTFGIAAVAIIFSQIEDNSSRFAPLLVWVFIGPLANIPALAFSAYFVQDTLRTLPDNEISKRVRKKLKTFKRICYREIQHLAFFTLYSLVVCFFMRPYAVAMNQMIALAIALSIIVAQLTTLLKHPQQNGDGRHGTRSRAVFPSDGPTLDTLEKDGRKAFAWEQQEADAVLPFDADASSSKGSQSIDVMGVSFALLEQFALENGIPEEMTMQEVCSVYIKPKTLFDTSGMRAIRGEKLGSRSSGSGNIPLGDQERVLHHCPYGEVVRKGVDSAGFPLVARSTVFLSYTWSYEWGVVLSALRSFEEQTTGSDPGTIRAGDDESSSNTTLRAPLSKPAAADPTPDSISSPSTAKRNYYFIDQFCLDQNVMTSGATLLSKEAMQHEIVAKLKQSIEVPGRVLMLLHPWHTPVVLSRAWCLFEAYTAILSGSVLQMFLAPQDEKEMFGALDRGAFDARAMCEGLDAAQATASFADDRDMILTEIKEHIGLAEYNQQLRQYLREQLSLVAVHGRRGSLHTSGPK